MGVIGLWSILDAGARPVRLEALAKKRLAVDASIWIYQFLKAVRDKEGNVLKNAHVVGFFRRICKLLFHGIQPVFVFDGKAPLLKRQTLRNRKVLREGGRIDVAKTAGKILAVQMRKRALEEAERVKAAENRGQEEEIPENPVYFDQLELKDAEIERPRFKKTDQYHLPEMDVSIDRAGSVNDPRIMTHEELQAYAQDFEGGEDLSLYDFSHIDYDGEMFQSLPHADQYSILNAARLRSRLRMGLSTEQLTDMFPDRMAFSRFQIERVKERSDLTNRLMNLNGMNDIGVQRIASERGKEYVLIKNETENGGWSLGVINTAERPIVIDKELAEAPEAEEEDEEFEDVPIVGVSAGPSLDTVGMSEEDMIKFALEESRRAQLSSTRPAPDFRPSNRRNTSQLQSTRGSQKTSKEIPLFITDDSKEDNMLESPQPQITSLARSSSSQEQDLMAIEEEEKQEELRRSLSSSLHRVPEDRSEPTNTSGGFVLEDDEDAETTILPINVSSLSSQAAKQEGSTASSSLPFQNIDFTQSILAKRPDRLPEREHTKPSQLDKLKTAMKSAIEPEGIDLSTIPDSEIRAENQTVSVKVASDTSREKTKSIPSWFAEEIGRPQSPPNTIEAVTEPETTSILGSGKILHDTVDLTKSDTSSSDEFEEISIEQQPNDLTTSESSSHVRTDVPAIIAQDSHDSVSESIAPQEAELALHASRKARDTTIQSPAWSASDSVGDHEAAQYEQGIEKSFERNDEVADTPGIPSLIPEDSLLDEVDQTRLDEEEDMRARMAAEEHEYARFSAELRNKKPENYTNVEYEQDLRALKNQQKKNLRDADEVTQIMVMECQELLAQFGIPYITATSEAESQCARLVQDNLVDGIVTDDSDVFLFGGTRVYRNMFNAAKTVECYVLSDLEREFDLDREKLIQLAHLLGSDYTEGIKKIGPVLALELVAEFPGKMGLAEFRDFVERVQTDRETEDDKMSPFRKKFRKTAEKLVLPDNFPNPLVWEAYVKPEVDTDTTAFEWGQPDVDALRSFLMRSCGWRQEYTDSQLLPVIKDMNLKLREGTQRNLTDFFRGSVGAGAAGIHKAVKSTRMHNALASLKTGNRSVTTQSQKRARPTPKASKDVNSAQDVTKEADLADDMPPPKKTQKKKVKRVTQDEASESVEDGQ